MHWAIVFFAAVFLLLTCHDNEQAAKAKAAEEARIEREVARRVEKARKEIAERDALFHTVSWIVLVVLTCGGVAKFVWFRRPRFTAPVMPVMPTTRAVQYSPRSYVIQQPRPQRVNYQAPRAGRVLDLRPAVSSPPVQQQPGSIRRRRRRRWNRDPGGQPDPPRRYHGTPPRS